MPDQNYHLLEAELSQVKDQPRDAREVALNAEKKLQEALARLNEKDAALQADRKNPDDFSWSVERGGHVLEKRTSATTIVLSLT